MATITLSNLISIYKVRYFEGNVLNEEKGDSCQHQDVPIQPDVQNHYATSPSDHFTKTSMMSTLSIFDFFLTIPNMLQMEEDQTLQVRTNEGQSSNVRGRGDLGHCKPTGSNSA